MGAVSAPKVVVVHERFTEVGGSENVVEQLSIEWPTAEVHVPIARSQGIPRGLSMPPYTGRLNRLYRWLGQGSYAPLLPLLPMSFRHLRLPAADVVLISHHAFATQAVFATDARAIAYVHSPARWAWDPQLRAGEAGGRLGGLALAALAVRTRREELAAAPRLARIVANSSAVAERIQRCWGREAQVVHPPVDTEYYTPDRSVEREDFFLLAGRMVPYKRPDLAVRAAREADVPLVVVGEGRFLQHCKELAGPRTTFLGRVPDAELRDLHRRSRALLMPGVEDFGIVPVEAMACGSPVIALNEGGAVDSVVPGVTGEMVVPGTDEVVIEGFVDALRSFRPGACDPAAVRKHAELFSRAAFRANMRRVVNEVAGQPV